jgi:hypothetical protein
MPFLRSLRAVGDFCGEKALTPSPNAPSRSRLVEAGDRVTIFSMPTEHILALLIAERNKLNRAIEALQGPTKRIGRPPKNPLAAAPPAATPAPKKKRRKFSAAQRQAASERMRKPWAAKKAEAKPTKKAESKGKRSAKAA